MFKKLDYESLTNSLIKNKKTSTVSHPYTALRASDYFHVGYSECDDIGTQFGWKLHISIHFENLPKGWNIAKDILVQHHVLHFKVVYPKKLAKEWQENGKDGGAEITIYAHEDDPNKNWKTILQDIQNALVEHNIRPGPKPRVDRKIQGSSYFYYRNSDDGKGKGVPSTYARSYNPGGFEDPYKNIINKNEQDEKYKVDLEKFFQINSDVPAYFRGKPISNNKSFRPVDTLKKNIKASNHKDDKKFSEKTEEKINANLGLSPICCISCCSFWSQSSQDALEKQQEGRKEQEEEKEEKMEYLPTSTNGM